VLLIPIVGAAQDVAAPPVADAAPAKPTIDPLDITGRTFAGLRLPVTPTPGRIGLRAQRAYVWTETDRLSPRPVQRIFLQGDAVLELGIYSFEARSASVWLERVDDVGPDAWQVFAYLDRAVTPMSGEAISLAGDKLPVQGIIIAPEGLDLRVDRLLQGRPNEAFPAEAEGALAARLRRLVEPPPPPAVSPEELLRRSQQVPPLEPLGETDEEALLRERREVARLERRLEPASRDQPIFSKSGVISLSAGAISIVPEGDRRAVVVSGGITVSYQDRRNGEERSVQISAERGVVFLDAAADAGSAAWSASDVRGIYLEGDVQAIIVTPEGRYAVRSPRVFYDVPNDRGLLVDAFFTTYDPRRGLPLYVRAKTISQLSSNTFRATDARVTNTPFLNPDLSIGASSVTVQQHAATASREQHITVDAQDITLRAGRLPFFWWPRIKGDPSLFPLRDIRLENSSGSGGAVKTTWNAYTLLGLDPPPGQSADVMFDYYFERGPGLGAQFTWANISSKGSFLGYTVPNDTGRDLLVTGVKRDAGGDFRGMLLGEHRARVGEHWTLFAEGAYISDPTFIDGFFEPLGRTRREFASSLYAQRIAANTRFWAEVRANANDFIANEYLLQSPGYTVTRLPDVGYMRLADDLLDGYPGLLTYSSEYRFSQMRLRFAQPDVDELGFTNLVRSQALFGISPGQSIADALHAGGLREDWVSRFDTRHELAMPIAAGPLNITPFLVGRFTGYDQDFSEFSPDADEPVRLWGAAGLTLSTELQRVDNGVESRLLDLHRIRHIITPSITLWHAGTTIDRADLPVYDAGVESIAEGTATRFAVNQVWQTQRGGPGRWRSVDVFRLDTELVVSSDDVDEEGPINRYFSYRPEYSSLIGGTFATIDAAWQVTEVFALAAHEIYDFESSQSDRTGVGALIQHGPEFSTFAELRFINPQDQTYALLGFNYELTRKYTIQTSLNYDTDRADVQSVNAQLRRRFPSVVLGVGIGYNNITSETSFGFVFQPFGLDSGRSGIRDTGDDGNFGFGG
jgi:hypothetical protein